MFKSAMFKLTISYLAVLVVISIFFSLQIFLVASRELHRSFNKPALLQELRQEFPADITPGDLLPGQKRPALDALLAERIRDGRRQLGFNLLYLNLAVLLAGGAASYWLARWTLRPIELSHEAQSRFAADASHELRTPLTAMRTETEVALRDPRLHLEQAKKQLKSNLQELDKLTGLTDGLLRLARIDTEQMHLEPVVLNDVLATALGRVKSAAQQKGIQIESPSQGGEKIMADQAALVELFVLLLENAIKYSPQKSQVRIVQKNRDAHVTVSILDQGPGIPKDQQKNIFMRFYRADVSRNKKIPGYGLGLAIAKSIADAHDATLSLESGSGVGSTFMVTFSKRRSD
jgi:two-component system sensor histidine kinase CiaH